MTDAWPIVTEQFVQWVIEDNFTMGRPDWTLGGAVFSNEIEAWENMKLRCLNGAHSTLAYLGQLTGRETVAEAMQLPLITGILDALWTEVLQVLHAPAGVDPTGYVEQLKLRFCNPALKHRTAQIAMDGSQKLPQRLLATLRERLAAGLPSPALATAIAGWMHFAVKTAHTPGAVLNDPLSGDILAQARASHDSTAIIDNLLGIDKIFGSDLKTHAGFKVEVLAGLRQLAAHPAGVAAPEFVLSPTLFTPHDSGVHCNENDFPLVWRIRPRQARIHPPNPRHVRHCFCHLRCAGRRGLAAGQVASPALAYRRRRPQVRGGRKCAGARGHQARQAHA
jgi:fructuronate reductase